MRREAGSGRGDDNCPPEFFCLIIVVFAPALVGLPHFVGLLVHGNFFGLFVWWGNGPGAGFWLGQIEKVLGLIV
jgi:hypothetical protein